MFGIEPVSKEDDEYRSYLADGEFRCQKCLDCGHLRAPSQPICPECLAEYYCWEPVSGVAIVETFTWYLKPFDDRCTQVPYNVALVRLSEGPRLITNIVDVSMNDLQVGLGVRARAVRGNQGRPIVVFAPGT